MKKIRADKRGFFNKNNNPQGNKGIASASQEDRPVAIFLSWGFSIFRRADENIEQTKTIKNQMQRHNAIFQRDLAKTSHQGSFENGSVAPKDEKGGWAIMNGLSVTEAIRFIKACEKASEISSLSYQCKEELVDAAQEIQKRLDLAINQNAILN